MAKQAANHILTLIEMSEEAEMDIQFDDLENEFEELFGYLTEEMVEEVKRVIYCDKGALECCYGDLKKLFENL